MFWPRFSKHLACFTKVFASISIVLLAMALPLGDSNDVQADIDGVCVMYCDEPSSTTYDNGGYGYGGGCATGGYDDGYYGGVTSVGDYHSVHPNVVWDGEYWVPADGYYYVSDDPNDFRVERITGSYHPVHPNVIWDGDYWVPEDGFYYVSDDPDNYTVARVIGSSHPDYPYTIWNGDLWEPADGYIWASDDEEDLATILRPVGAAHPDYPNTIWNGESWEPAKGYVWASGDVDDLATILRPVGYAHDDHPYTIWDGEMWGPAEGYIWASEDPENLATIPRPVGSAHKDHPNTAWTGDGWEPADGYIWVSDDPDDLRVIPDPAMASLPTGPTLSIADVPSPSGYRTEAERREQLAKLSDEHIERELIRIRETLVRMKADFENDTADLQAWLKEAQTAEDDALKDSFGLLIGGSLDQYEELWDKYPRLKIIAKEGWDLAGKLEQAIKASENPADIEIYRGLLRDKMISTYKLLAEMGSDLATEAGGKVIDLGKFMVDYSYHMTRWGLARNQIHAISDNLDGPNGKLEAQLAIKELQEDLINEQKRRLANAP